MALKASSSSNSDEFNVAIIGGGILGTTLAYWLANCFTNARIAVIEKEKEVGLHASSRNTGVVHRPFYLDPQRKKIFARSALLSYPLWERYAQARGIPWKKIGTIEVATDKPQTKVLEKYLRWASENGMREKELLLLDQKSLEKTEPNVSGFAGLFCQTDVATDFGLLTQSLAEDAKNKGVKFLLGFELEQVEEIGGRLSLIFKNGMKFSTSYLINCAGGNATKIAHLLGVAREFTDLNFRGEYWVVDPHYANLARYNIYSVPRFGEFPFLDPHWVIRWDGQVAVGPNAVPVIGPYSYEGLYESVPEILKKIFERPIKNKMKLFLNWEFMRLAIGEWQGSFFKEALVKRIQRFLPKVRSEFLVKRGPAGIRSSVIDQNGSFVREALEFFGPHSFHILNFNSPGATGTPAYTAYMLNKMLVNHQLGHLGRIKAVKKQTWDFNEIISGFE